MADVLVVVPTLGERADLLLDMLDSVTAQTGVSTRLVVVLPPSASGARAAAAERGADLVDDPRTGLSGAVNAGIAAADGERFLAWAGDDDLLRPGGLARLAALLDSHPRATAAYGGCDYIDPEGRLLRTNRVGALASRIMGWGPNLVPQPGSLIRLSALETAGTYDESLRYAMDLDMFLRLRRQGPLVSTREVVAAFRWHPDSLTVSAHDRSTREAQLVKRRYLPSALRPLAPVWEAPLRLASHLAAGQVARPS